MKLNQTKLPRGLKVVYLSYILMSILRCKTAFGPFVNKINLIYPKNKVKLFSGGFSKIMPNSQNWAISFDKIKLIFYPRVRNSTTHLTLKYTDKFFALVFIPWMQIHNFMLIQKLLVLYAFFLLSFHFSRLMRGKIKKKCTRRTHFSVKLYNTPLALCMLSLNSLQTFSIFLYDMILKKGF